MLSKIIFVLATVCVINASVITVNVYDDDPETEVASNPKDCNFQACDQLCRRLKFPGGACVNGRCKCDNFLNAEENVSEENAMDQEDSMSLKDDNNIGDDTKKSDCNNQACDQLCRRLKFTGGVCVNGRCKCDNFLNAEVTVSDESLANSEDFVTPKACRSDKCNELCRKIKLRGGACIDGRCFCNRPFSQQDELTDTAEFTVEDSVSSRASNNKKCNQLCRKQKFRGGACLGPNCYCNKFLSLQDETMIDPAETLALSSCNSITCDDQCRRSGWHSGVCINGQCKCDYFLNSEVDAVEEYSELATRRVCRLTKCNRTCTRRGYEGAACVKGRCKCYNITKTSLPVSELSEGPTQRSCNMQACDQLCRRLKFPGGACVNGRCKCDNFLGIDVDAVDEYSELATRRVCNLRQCNHTCARRGYASSRCVNGWCRCFDKIQREDASPANDVTSDENEESNEVLSNEEQLIDPAPSACDTVSCNQWCRRLKYTGGWCRLGQCQCF